MSGAWDGKTCPVCGTGTLKDGLKTEHIEYRGRKLTATQPGAYCDRCDDGIAYHSPEIEAAWKKQRDTIDEEESAELLAIRHRLGLTQQQAAELSGGGHNAFSRYERGEAHPVMAVMHLFRLLDRYPNLLLELRGWGLEKPNWYMAHASVTSGIIGFNPVGSIARCTGQLVAYNAIPFNLNPDNNSSVLTIARTYTLQWEERSLHR